MEDLYMLITQFQERKENRENKDFNKEEISMEETESLTVDSKEKLWIFNKHYNHYIFNIG